MAIIVPTVLTSETTEFVTQLQAFHNFAKRIQIDISDGTFAPSQTVLPKDMRLPTDVQIDLHMMVAKPSDYITQVISLKPSMCILHAEVDDDLSSLAQQLRSAGIKFGIALLKTTFPRRAQGLISEADHVLIFAGKLGEQGGTIDMLQTEKVPLIKSLNPSVEIGWDGGANLSNVRALAHDGIDVINVGSALSQSTDKVAMYQSLLAESEKKGVLV